MIEIRTAHVDDADAMCDAHVAAWRVGYAHAFPASILYADDFESSRRERWRAWTWPTTIGGEMFVPVLDGRVVGFAHAGPERERNGAVRDRGEVYGFYLHPDAWGSGAAASLMVTAEAHLSTLGFHEAVLWVLEDNPRGRGFYEKAGWQPSGERADFDRYCDAVVPEVEYHRALS